MNKLETFCQYIDTDYSENSDDCPVSIDNNTYEYLNEEYLVLTDEEANVLTHKYITENLWSFHAYFLLYFMNCTKKMDPRDEDTFCEALEEIQFRLAESANPMLYALVESNLPALIKDAIRSDGRGHFLALYDFEEREVGDYFIYRVN